MSLKTDLIARLEAEAVTWDTRHREAMSMHDWSQRQRNDELKIVWWHNAKRAEQHAADLRAAAAAVRLVWECREALIGWCSERKREQALASIAEWEGKHGQ